MQASVLARSSAGPYVDRTPDLPPAGIVSAPLSFRGEPAPTPNATQGASQSQLTDFGRPITPEHVARYRREAKYPLGASTSTLRTVPQDITFGVRTKASESAADLLHGDASRASVQSRLLSLREQATYASAAKEPLGQVPKLGAAPPEAHSMTHGASTNYGESAKSVLYAPSDDAGSGRRLLSDGRTAGRLEAGEQRRRGYNWDAAAAGHGAVGVDVSKHTFGRAPKASVENAGDAIKGRLPPIMPNKARPTDAAASAAGDSSRLCTVLGGGGLPSAYRTHVKPRRDVHPGMRRSDPPVGKAVPRGSVPPDANFDERVFGRKGASDGVSAAHLIHSGWTEDQAAPDKTVGRCLRRGPVTRPAPHTGSPVDLAAGVATVRHDKTVPELRKVTDFTTYGDALAAGNLIAPPKYGGLGVSEMDFLKQRPQEELREMTTAAGFGLTDEEFAFAWKEASGGKPTCSIEAFRSVCDQHFL